MIIKCSWMKFEAIIVNVCTFLCKMFAWPFLHFCSRTFFDFLTDLLTLLFFFELSKFLVFWMKVWGWNRLWGHHIIRKGIISDRLPRSQGFETMWGSFFVPIKHFYATPPSKLNCPPPGPSRAIHPTDYVCVCLCFRLVFITGNSAPLKAVLQLE